MKNLKNSMKSEILLDHFHTTTFVYVMCMICLQVLSDLSTVTGELLYLITCLLHKDGEILLCPLPKNASKFASFFRPVIFVLSVKRGRL